ncbi:MAG: HAD-IIIA family hydrolase [Anaerolineae bacterium]|nr:HAD-IIIA family hydrolase [Anaerolineae bacterium]
MNLDNVQRARSIRLLALDCDGVLTDGSTYIVEDGREFRRFNVHDGLGLKLAMEDGIHVAIISGADGSSVLHRARQLGIEHVLTGVSDKLVALTELCTQLGIKLEHVAYMGDDLPDLPVMQRVGLACAPANAVRAVKDCATLITEHEGGHGAVREVCDILITSRSS